MEKPTHKRIQTYTKWASPRMRLCFFFVCCRCCYCCFSLRLIFCLFFFLIRSVSFPFWRDIYWTRFVDDVNQRQVYYGLEKGYYVFRSFYYDYFAAHNFWAKTHVRIIQVNKIGGSNRNWIDVWVKLFFCVFHVFRGLYSIFVFVYGRFFSQSIRCFVNRPTDSIDTRNQNILFRLAAFTFAFLYNIHFNWSNAIQ